MPTFAGNTDITFTLRLRNQATRALSQFRKQLRALGTTAQKTRAGLLKTAATFTKVGLAALKAGTRIKTAGASIREAGIAISFAIGAPLVAVVRTSIKAFADYDLAIAGVQKTVQTTPAVLERLRGEFVDLSNRIPIASTELAKIGQIAGQLGIQVPNILSFTEVIAKIGVATDLTTDRAALALARLSNILQVPQENIDQLGASLVDLGNNFAATESEIIEFALRLAPVAKTVGLSAGEVLGFSTALATVGIRAQAGATAVSRAFVKIAQDVAQGSDRLFEFARVAGVSVDQFSRLFKKDASRALALFIDGLSDARKAGVDVFTILEDLGLSEIRTRKALLGLSLATGQLTGALDRGNKAFEENIALNVEAALFFEAVANKIVVLGNAFRNAAAALGAAFEPEIREVVEVLTQFFIRMQDAIKALNSLSKTTKRTIIIVTALLVALGPLLFLLGTFVTLLGFATQVAGTFVLGLGVLAGAFKFLFRTLILGSIKFLFTNPIGLALVAIGLVVLAVRAWRDEMVTFGGKSARVIDFVRAGFQVLGDVIAGAAGLFVQTWNQGFQILNFLLNDAGDAVDITAQNMGDAFLALGDTIANAFKFVGIVILLPLRIAFRILDNLVKKVVDKITFIRELTDAIKKGDLALADSLGRVFAKNEVGVFEGVNELALKAEQDIADIFSGDSTPISDAFAVVADRAAVFFRNHVLEGINKPKNPLSQAFEEGAPEALKTVARLARIFGKTFEEGFREGLVGALVKFGKEAKDVAQLTEDAFLNAFTTIEDAMLDFLETGEFNFREFALSITREFNRIAVKSIIGDLLNLAKGGEIEGGGFLAGLADLFTGSSFSQGRAERTVGIDADLSEAFAAFPELFGTGTSGGISDDIQRVFVENPEIFGANAAVLSQGEEIKNDLQTLIAGDTALFGGASQSEQIGADLDSLFAANTDLFGGAGGEGQLTPDGLAITAGLSAQTAAQPGFFSRLGASVSTGLSTLGTNLSQGFSNLLGSLQNLGSTLLGLLGGGGGSESTGRQVAGLISGLGGLFGGTGAATAAEGGISDMLSRNTVVPRALFANARRFAEGGVTSGKDNIPALLSRNEAIVPLSRNRAIPIENAGPTNVTVQIMTNDVESFQRSRSQSLAKFGLEMSRASKKTR